MAAAAAASRQRRRQPTAAATAPLAAPGPAPPRPPRPLGWPAPAACGEERQRGGRGRVSGGGAMGLIGTAGIPSSIHLSSIRACKPCQACASFPESAMPVAKIAHGQHDWGSRGGGSSASRSGRDEREEGGACRGLRPNKKPPRRRTQQGAWQQAPFPSVVNLVCTPVTHCSVSNAQQTSRATNASAGASLAPDAVGGASWARKMDRWDETVYDVESEDEEVRRGLGLLLST